MSNEVRSGRGIPVVPRQEILDSRLERVTLVCQPTVPPMTWDSFVAGTTPFSIALDGFVNHPPAYDDTGPHINFDHHVGVDRLATRSTSGQVAMGLRQGLYERFRDADGPRATLYVNDADEDVCLSVFQLRHGRLAERTNIPRLNRLVDITDKMDATAGAYPLDADLPFLEELAWVNDPYRDFRSSGGVDRKNAQEFENVIYDVEGRIISHLAGEGESQSLDTRYAQIGGGDGWSMVEETGAQARTGMLSNGIKAFVSVRQRPNGRWTYVLGRMSVFVQFPIPELYDALNAAEQITEDRWGGSNTIGGSPRVAGSELPPPDVEMIVNQLII
jgi:hypothetical protein